MIKIDSFIQDYLEGKPLYAPLVKVFDILFTVSITSFIFTRFYFPYSLIDITDYKTLYRFFIDGHFWIPLMICTVVHYAIGLSSSLLFSLTTQWQSARWIEDALKTRFTKKDIKVFFRTLNDNPFVPRTQRIEPSSFFKYYEHIKNSVPPEQWTESLKLVDKKKKEIKTNFKLVAKAGIAVSLYFIGLGYFGWVLYAGSIVLFAGLLVFFFYVFLILDVAPVVIRKMDAVFRELQAGFAAAETATVASGVE